MQVQNNIQKNILQDDKTNWREHKLNSLKLADSYQRLHIYNKSDRVRTCGDTLVYKRVEDVRKFYQSHFCKVRLCPTCGKRRSLKTFGQVSKVMDHLDKEKPYEYIFLTLTQKNVEADELANELDKLFLGFNKLTKRKAFKNAIKGWFRALEVTHENNTYHPHFHVILAVNKSYFKKAEYISQKKWVNMWRESLRLDYDPIVHVKRIKALGENKTLKGAVAEVAKYTIKSNDYLIRNANGDIDEVETDKAVLVLDNALAHRRLVSFGGVLRKAHKELNLDNAIEGDLNDDHSETSVEIRADLNYVLEYYDWNIGYKNYIKVREEYVSGEHNDTMCDTMCDTMRDTMRDTE